MRFWHTSGFSRFYVNGYAIWHSDIVSEVYVAHSAAADLSVDKDLAHHPDLVTASACDGASEHTHRFGFSACLFPVFTGRFNDYH
jgi:hypothetical protein